jgi:hypothetical protein
LKITRRNSNIIQFIVIGMVIYISKQMVKQDGIISIYCHWDGHIETNGKILFENYNREKTEQLIALGNISSLGTLLATNESKSHI